MTSIIRVLGSGDGLFVADRDLWVESYDTDAAADTRFSHTEPDGRVVINGAFGGRIRLTPRRDEARQFSDVAEAMRAWNAQSQRRPRRPDGKPNKPMTALTIQVEPNQ